MGNKNQHMQSKSKSKFPCAGIIVFDADKTILVSTDRGNLSFPKGKREKNETNIDTAWRELNEETGLEKNRIKLVNNYFFDEYTDKGNPSVRYFVGNLVGTYNNFKFDPKELANVGWYSVFDVTKFDKLKKARREILENAYKVAVVHR